MNAEQEALILALDAVIDARTGAEAKRLEAIYQSRLDDVLSRCPGISRERLMLMVSSSRNRWLKAQSRPSTLPPKA
jgi:hypothetical protein